MKYSKRTIISAAVVASLAVTGVAYAQYGDIQIVPAKPTVKSQPVEAPKSEPVVQPTIEETPVSNTADNTSTQTTENTTPLSDTPTQTNNEVTPNEPAPEVPAVVEPDPTPEPLPAPATPIANVANPNTSVGNDTIGTVSHN